MSAGLRAVLGLGAVVYALAAMLVGSQLEHAGSDGRPMLELNWQFYVFHWSVFAVGVYAWCRACRAWLTPPPPPTDE